MRKKRSKVEGWRFEGAVLRPRTKTRKRRATRRKRRIRAEVIVNVTVTTRMNSAGR